MDLSALPRDLPIPKDDGKANHLLDLTIPKISLPNQDGNFLSLNRSDTFRLVVYFFPMTGNPNKPLPKNWNSIPGAKGCTPQTCTFRDNYEKFTTLNAIPVGISTQTIEDLKEMTRRLNVNYDVLSDYKLLLTNTLQLPVFKINEKIFIKRLTIILDQSKIKKFFYPVFPPHLHYKEVIKWLEEN